MQFTSIEFLLFFVAAFAGYWLIGYDKVKLQNIFLLAASYVFYCVWDWRLLSILLIVSLSTYCTGLLLAQCCESRRRRICLYFNIFICLGLLCLFKYYGFFVNELSSLLNKDIGSDYLLSKLILPLGISFYTFKAISYSVDVYRGEINAERDPVPVLLYVSFFPQLLAGPIEKASSFIPQTHCKRYFDNAEASDSMRRILWGLFKKVVIADQCAIFVDEIFNVYQSQCGSTLLIAAVLYSFQIYCDFSGYSDISIGISELLGFKINPNFKTPYFSRNIAEFWRRWHISLTSWFKHYVYFPLGGSRCSTAKVIRNTAVVFILSGIWHGANWTYLSWGLYYALLFVPLLVTGRNKRYKTNCAEFKVVDFVKIFGTFALVILGWIIFRSDSITDAITYCSGMLQLGTFKAVFRFFSLDSTRLISILIVFMLIVEWIDRDSPTPLFHLKKMPASIRYASYVALASAVFWFWNNASAFVYQQF